jgi:hypothetical protein
MIGYQAKQVWRKLAAWYGADVIERKFGAEIPQDWAAAIDGIDDDKLEGVLADVRIKHPTWPPGLPEFEQLIKAANRPVYQEGPTITDRLDAYVLRTRRLTPVQQLSMSWKYLYRGNPRTGEGLETTGVVIAADGDAPGYRVMVMDMLAEVA